MLTHLYLLLVSNTVSYVVRDALVHCLQFDDLFFIFFFRTLFLMLCVAPFAKQSQLGVALMLLGLSLVMTCAARWATMRISNVN